MGLQRHRFQSPQVPPRKCTFPSTRHLLRYIRWRQDCLSRSALRDPRGPRRGRGLHREARHKTCRGQLEAADYHEYQSFFRPLGPADDIQVEIKTRQGLEDIK